MPAGSFWPLPAVVAFDPAAPRAPDLREADFLTSLQNLLPPGRAWTRDPGAILTGLLRGLATGWERVHQRALQLLIDAFPANTEELLPEWEQTVGLPDPCAGPEPSVSLRRVQVMARIQNAGGQSIPYFIAFALRLGYAITITEFAPFRVGMTVGLPLYGEAWAYAWEVHTPEFSVHYFLVGTDTAGNPLASWGDTILQCELQRIKPGHTILFFTYAYGGAGSPFVLDETALDDPDHVL